MNNKLVQYGTAILAIMALTTTMLLLIIDQKSYILSKRHQAIRITKTNRINFKIYNKSHNLFKIKRTINLSSINQIKAKYLHHLSELSSIPKIMHISWLDNNVLNSQTQIIQLGIVSFIKLNSLWTVIIYDDDEIQQYIKSKISLFDYKLIQNKHIIEKVDLWRLLIIYFEGGMYSDIDRLFSITMDDLIDTTVKMLLPTHYDINFSQDLMCSAASNELFKLAIELNLSKRRIFAAQQDTANISEFERILELGPQTFWEAATKTLFGVLMKDGGDYPDENKVVVAKMRKVIEQANVMKTYRETWCDTIVFHTDNMTHCRSIRKENLWQDTNGKLHWEQDIKLNSSTSFGGKTS